MDMSRSTDLWTVNFIEFIYQMNCEEGGCVLWDEGMDK